MAVLGWGKPRILVKDLDATGAAWEELPTPVENSTQLATTKGDKQEAKIEGGENEDVKYGKNTYALTFNIRAAKGRVLAEPVCMGAEDSALRHGQDDQYKKENNER